MNCRGEICACAVAPLTAAAAPQQDGPSSGLLVIVAYVMIWVVLLAYVLVLARRQRRLQRELDQLRRQLSGSSAGGPGEAPPTERAETR